MSTTTTALKRFALRSTEASFEDRYDWARTGHSKAEVESIWDEVVAKVPAGATKVLEIGSGSGEFYQRLVAARPGINYLGIDLVPQNVADARALVGGDPSLFEVSTAWDALMREDADWDFVVSVHSAFSYTTERHSPLLLQLLDAKSPKGFVVLYEASRFRASALGLAMGNVLANSTNEAESYYEGARAFLDDSLLKGLFPFYVHRDATTTETPRVPAKLCRLQGGGGAFNRVLEKVHWRREVRALQKAEPAEFVGVDLLGGRVTGTSSKTIDSDVAARLRKFGA